MASSRARPAPSLRDGAVESEANTPRQPDVAARQAAATVQPRMLLQAPLYTSLAAPTNAQWLAAGFQLVLGAGFFGIYQHAGALRAIAKLGLHDRIHELCGLSSGAIAGALYATLGPVGLTESILSLSLLDFLDLTPQQAWRQGALCAGRAVAAKIAHDTGRYGCTRLEDAPGPKLRLAVFDGLAGETVWHTKGPLAETVARSAALPVLFANDGHFDGGWVDHHGYTALRPGRRALSLRMNTGLEPDAMQRRVQRPWPSFNVSADPEHATVAIEPVERIAGLSFLVDIDWRKDKLVAIVEECELLFTWWAHQPQGAPLPPLPTPSPTPPRSGLATFAQAASRWVLPR